MANGKLHTWSFTHESEGECLARIKPELDELNSIEDYWLFPAPNPDHVVGRAGYFNPMAHWLRLGWVENRELRTPENVRNAEGR
jgi:hypothetical protein